MTDLVDDQVWNKDTFIPKVGKRGAAIIEARGLSSAASAANAAIDHVHDWLLGSDGKWVTMGVPSDGSYDIPEDVIYGFPVVTKDGKYEIVKGLEIDAFSREKHGLHAQGTHRGAGRRQASAGLRTRPWPAHGDRSSARPSSTRSRCQVIGAINAYTARMAEHDRLQGAVPVGRRRGREFARHARSRHQHDGRRADRRASHHRRDVAAAAGRHRRGLGRRFQHRAHDPPIRAGRRRGGPHGGPGRHQALRPPTRQGSGLEGRDGRPHQGGGRRAAGRRLRDHGAHRRAGDRRASTRRWSARWRTSRPGPT